MVALAHVADERRVLVRVFDDPGRRAHPFATMLAFQPADGEMRAAQPPVMLQEGGVQRHRGRGPGERHRLGGEFLAQHHAPARGDARTSMARAAGPAASAAPKYSRPRRPPRARIPARRRRRPSSVDRSSPSSRAMRAMSRMMTRVVNVASGRNPARPAKPPQEPAHRDRRAGWRRLPPGMSMPRIATS